jgi:hypothetical protein
MVEYKVLTAVPESGAEKILNHWATEGWRVVAAVQGPTSAAGMRIILERPLDKRT